MVNTLTWHHPTGTCDHDVCCAWHCEECHEILEEEHRADVLGEDT